MNNKNSRAFAPIPFNLLSSNGQFIKHNFVDKYHSLSRHKKCKKCGIEKKTYTFKGNEITHYFFENSPQNIVSVQPTCKAPAQNNQLDLFN